MKINSFIKKMIALSISIMVLLSFSSTTSVFGKSKDDKIEKLRKSVVRIVSYLKQSNDSRKPIFSGSGFLIGENENGPAQYIVTNYHVIDPVLLQDNITITDDERQYINYVNSKHSREELAELLLHVAVRISKDNEIEVEQKPVMQLPNTDLAILKLKQPLNRPCVVFSVDSELKVGQKLITIGFPGKAYNNGMLNGDPSETTVTYGNISKMMEMPSEGLLIKAFQTDAAINEGNSGGPVANEDGQIIGIVRAKITNAEGIGYCIQNSELLPQLDNLSIPYLKASTKIIPEVSPTVTPEDKNTFFSVDKILLIVLAGVAIILIVILVVILITRKKQPIENQKIEQPNYIPGNEAIVTNKINAKLIGISGYFRGNSIDMNEEILALGRDPLQCQLVFPISESEVGRKHCVISFNYSNNTFILIDCASTNGTYLQNGQKLDANRSYVLKSGERFYLSNEENLFEVRLS